MRTAALGKVAKIDRTVATDDECLTLPYVGLEHVEKESGRFADGFVPTPLNMLATNFRFTPKHVLYGKLRPYLNKVVLPNFDGVCTTEILPILPNEEKLDRTFLWAILLSPTFVDWATSQISGANLPRLDPKLLAEYEVPLPPLTEQKRIASLLARADRLRHLRRTAHDLGDSVLQSVFLEMFGDVKLNQKGWDVFPLEDIVQPGRIITYGIVQAGPHIEDGIPYIRTGDIKEGQIVVVGLLRTSKEIAAKYKRSEVKAGELVMSIRATVGTIAELPPQLDGANLTQGTARISPGSKVNKKYLLYAIRSQGSQKLIEDRVKGATFREITLEALREVPMIVPPLNLQEEFAGVVARVESLRGRMSEGERQVSGLFESLLAQSFGNQ